MSGPTSNFTDPFMNDFSNIPYNNIPQIPQPERAILNHAHASEHSTSVFSVLASASHDALIRSGNAAYASINALHVQTKYELQEQRCGISA
jgi:hypothetical protein